MAADQATVIPAPARVALDLVSRMEVLAEESEWNRVEGLAQKLQTVVLDIPESERRAVVVAVSDRLERLRTVALVSRGEVTGKLSGIRRGQAATLAYGQPRSSGTMPA